MTRPRKKSRRRRESNPGSSALEVDAHEPITHSWGSVDQEEQYIYRGTMFEEHVFEGETLVTVYQLTTQLTCTLTDDLFFLTHVTRSDSAAPTMPRTQMTICRMALSRSTLCNFSVMCTHNPMRLATT